jgi:hypothetical protein
MPGVAAVDFAIAGAAPDVADTGDAGGAARGAALRPAAAGALAL